jgi:hypothetical protein
MSTLRQAAQQALEALESVYPYTDSLICYASTTGEHPPNAIDGNVRDAINALRAALAEPEQELGQALKQAIEHINELEALNAELVGALKHAAECKATPRKPLTDAEIQTIWAKTFEMGLSANIFARAIERAHGIGDQHEAG